MIGGLETVRVAGARSRAAAGFVGLPFSVYRANANWVPWFRGDVRALIERKHPFFEHSSGDFFIVRRDSRVCGRIAVMENTRYNRQHSMRSAHFYFFDFIDDGDVARSLVMAAADWARSRKLDILIGPMGFGGLTGGGVLIDGFNSRAAMTMMSYNHPYYRTYLEQNSFAKFIDQYSAYLDPGSFELPARVERLARRVLERGRFKVLRFKRKADLKKVAFQVGQIYNETETDKIATYTYSDAELRYVINDLLVVADLSLAKVLAYRDEVCGFLLGFPDLSAAIQRANGRFSPWSLVQLLRETKKTRSLIINGMGILPRFQRLGGNALLYYELAQTARSRRFDQVDLTQIAETTGLMLSDITALGAKIYKTHRIYQLRL